MKTGGYLPKFVMIVSGLFLMACLLPGMIPLTSETTAPMPIMEKDADALLEVLRGQDWVYLQALAEEQYAESDYSKPGSLRFTVHIPDNTPTYFNYGWCATSDEILKQNFEHIQVKLYFNDAELGKDVVHPISFARTDGLKCLDFGVLLSEWPAGEYKLESVATFDERIYDGLAYFDPGDYVYEYNVSVKE